MYCMRLNSIEMSHPKALVVHWVLSFAYRHSRRKKGFSITLHIFASCHWLPWKCQFASSKVALTIFVIFVGYIYFLEVFLHLNREDNACSSSFQFRKTFTCELSVFLCQMVISHFICLSRFRVRSVKSFFESKNKTWLFTDRALKQWFFRSIVCKRGRWTRSIT